mgnify:CR=1 FL=1
MSGSYRFVRLFRWLCAAWLLLMFVGGCKPEFTESECETDSDCFADETCSEQGVCVISGTGSMLPEVANFTADPSEVEEGGSVTLTWETQNAASGEITSTAIGYTYMIPEADLASGSTTVENLTQDATFTLTLLQGTRRATETVSVTVTPAENPPVIESFTVMPENVVEGDRIALEWVTSGATSGQISYNDEVFPIGEDELDSGVYRLDITETTTFELTMTNEFGEVAEDLVVEVTPANVPVIDSFTADAPEVAVGGSVLLSWETSGAESLAISDANGEVFSSTDSAEVAAGMTSVTVDADATYTLTASNGAGDVTAAVTVTVVTPPVINSFTASQETDVVPGSTIDLSWDVTDAEMIVITDSADGMVTTSMMATGSVSVQIDAAETFTLTATNSGGEVTETVSVSVLGAPVINSFTASQDTDVITGSTIDLSWDVTGADSIEITDAGGASLTTSTMASGTATVLVSGDETFTLTASNGAGDVTSMVMVTVLRAPMVNSFTASQTMNIVPGDTVDLSWDVTGADNIEITDAGGNSIHTSTMATGSHTVTVNADETYTLTATNAGGSAGAVVTVAVLRPPTIGSFTSSQTSDVVPGSSVNLDWTVNNATGIEITDELGASVTTSTMNSGTFTVVINSNKTYTLAATNAAGTTTSSPLQITILGSPAVNSFTASQTSDILSGSTIDLSWDVTDAMTIEIADSGGNNVTTSSMATGTVNVTVTADETYTLSATNATGTTTAMVSVTILVAPTINSFTASPDSNLIVNDSVDLSWDVSGADNIAITDSGGNSVTTSTMATGTFAVTAQQDETYTLTATNAAGSTTSTASITLRPTPTVNAFTASQTTDVPNGGMISLSWNTSEADSIEITDSGGNNLTTSNMAIGTFGVTVTADETYTLTAINGNGQAQATVSVTVLPAPTINSFTATPNTDVAPGSMVSLAWDVSGSMNIAITDSGGSTVHTSSMATGMHTVTVTADETYTLTATNPSGSATATAGVTVTVPVPTINNFTASPNMNVLPGAMVDLAWDVSGADNIAITDSGGNPVHMSTMAMGTHTVTVNANETYTLTATNAGGSSTATASVSLSTSPPTINSFTASPDTDVTPGGTSTLSWDVSAVDSIEITDSGGNTVHTSNMATGSTSVTVTADETYTLTATNANGSSTATASVTVLEAPTIDTFTVSQDTDVPLGSDVTFNWAVTNPAQITLTDSGGNTLLDTMMLTGMTDVTVTADETYTLTATNAAGSDSAMLSVTTLPLPVIDAYDADKTMTVSGEKVQLDWLTSGADSLTVTDDRGGMAYNVPMGDIASGSHTVFPQVTTVFTLTATNASGSVTSDVTVNVSAAKIMISEVLYDIAGADTDREWVELFNAGDTFVNLKHYSLGSGGTDYTSEVYQLGDVVIPPKGTVVVGGPTADGLNANPVFAQATAFAGIQNGGTDSDGLALFFAEAANVTAATVPIDNVVYSGVNNNGLLDEAGVAETVIAPDAPEGSSLARASDASDVFEIEAAPQPNIPVRVTGLDFTVGPNESLDTLTITGFGFAPDLDEIKLGNTDLNCIAVGVDQMLCDLVLPSSDVGTVDLTIKRVNFYDQDANGDAVIAPLPVAEQLTYTMLSAFTFEGQIADSGADFYCALFDPASPTATVNNPIDVQVLLYAQGVTEGNPGTLPPGWMVQAGYFDRADNPFEVYGITWVDFGTQADDGVNTNNEIFTVSLVSDTARLAEAGGRVSKDGGLTWTYCDTQSLASGSDDGWQNAGGADIEWTP